MTILVCGEALYDVFQVGEPVPGQLALLGALLVVMSAGLSLFWFHRIA